MKRTAAIAAFVSLMLGACGNESANTTPSIEGALTVANFSALPICWFGERGTVYFVADTEAFFYCDGRNYVAVDLRGLDGSDGVSWVVSVSEAPADLCPAGGALISAGPDEDGDGAADAVTSSQPVCNGIDGQDGMDGSSCTVSTDQSGTVTISCDDGTVATIPPGGGSGGSGGSGGTGGGPPDLLCPCYTEADLLASSATGCRLAERVERFSNLRVESVTTTTPFTRPNPGPLCPSPLFSCSPYVEEVGEFAARDYVENISTSEVSLRYEELSCDGPGEDSRIVSADEFGACEALIRGVFGPCSTCGDGNVDDGFEECDDGGPSTLCNELCEFIECFEDSDCSDDGNVCTRSDCSVYGQCQTVNLNGERCTTRLGETGQCLGGSCLPLSGGL